MYSNMQSINLIIHEDEFSFQIKHPEHSRFFVRIDKNVSSSDELIVTDFMLSGEKALGITALSLLRTKFFNPSPNMKFLFRDILPNEDCVDMKDRVVSEYDIIIEIVTSFSIEYGYEIINSFLDLDGSKFNAVIEIAKSNHSQI